MPAKVKTWRSGGGGGGVSHQNKRQGKRQPCHKETAPAVMECCCRLFSLVRPRCSRSPSHGGARVRFVPVPGGGSRFQGLLGGGWGSSRRRRPSPARSRQAPRQIIWGVLFVCSFYTSCWGGKKKALLIPSKAISSPQQDASWVLSAPPEFPKTQRGRR